MNKKTKNYLLCAIITSLSGQVVNAADGEKVVVRFKRHEIPTTGEVLYTASVSESFMIDLLGASAIEVCKRELVDGWSSCLCRRSEWVRFDVQLNGDEFSYYYSTFSGIHGSNYISNYNPFVWSIGRPLTDGSSGMESKQVSF